jgi:TonB family protein
MRWPLVSLLVALLIAGLRSAAAQDSAPAAAPRTPADAAPIGAVAPQDTPAQPPPSSSALARPLTPGDIAVLVLDRGSPDVSRRLAEAIRHARGDVRAVAARVATVTVARDLTPRFVEALAVETDHLAAREQIRALLLLGGTERHAAVIEAVERLGGSTAIVLAETIAHTRGEPLLDVLPVLSRKANDPQGLADALLIVMRDHGVDHARISRRLIESGDLRLWRVWQERLGLRGIDVDDTTRLLALRSPSAEMRTDSILLVAERLVDRRTVGAALVEAAQPPATGWPPAAPTEEDLGRELTARALKARPSAADWTPTLLSIGTRLPESLRKVLTGAERDARKRAGLDRKEKGRDEAPRLRTDWKPMPREARTITPLTPGLFAEMGALTGCPLRRESEYAAAQITYLSDGRPQHVTVFEASVPKGCVRFISAVMLLAAARPDHALKDHPKEVVFFPLQRAILECVDAAQSGRPPAAYNELGVTAPRLTRERKPEYTGAAMEAKAQGDVWLRAVVSESGCVSEATVTRSLHPGLDLQAIHAIMQWRFDPGLLDSRPIPVEISVAVSFRLK